MTVIDHLVLAGPDLQEAIDHVASELGVPPQPGGRHPTWGTCNALLSLGPDTYLEIVGPDPERTVHPVDIFGIRHLTRPRLVTWCARAVDLETRVLQATAAGVDLGPVIEGGRTRPDGVDLRWRNTDPLAPRVDGVVPFLIDWGDSPHPSRSLTSSIELQRLRVVHPEPTFVESVLRALAIPVPVESGPVPGIRATLLTPRGTIEL